MYGVAMETETTPLASRVPRTPGILWSNTKMRWPTLAQCAIFPLWAFLSSWRWSCRWALSQAASSVGRPTEESGYLGCGYDSQGKMRIVTALSGHCHRAPMNCYHTCLTVTFTRLQQKRYDVQA